MTRTQLVIRHGVNRHDQPLCTVNGFPGLDAEMTPEDMLALSRQLHQAANDARPATTGKAMTDKPEVRITKTMAAMARGCPLHKIQEICERQKSVSCSVLARMVEEAQDINTDYALSFKYAHEASRAADKARIAELESENEAVKGTLNDAVVDVQALCPDCRNGWLSRHCQDKPYMHEYQQERNELLGLLRDVRESVIDCVNYADNEGSDRRVQYYRDQLCRIDAALTQQGKEGGE